jgi:dTDP-glucose 4,6-dehydratase
MDGSKLEALGWRPRRTFDEGLPETVAWYRDHPAWVEAAKGGDWEGYYRRQYEGRLAKGQAAATGAPDAVPADAAPADVEAG